MRLLGVATPLVLLGAIIVGCGDGDDAASDGSQPTVTLSSTASLATSAATAPSGDGDRKVVEAPIDDLEVLVLESFPVQYNLRIVSGLPSGCVLFDKAEITGRNGNEITVRVTNTMPDDPNVACTAIYGTKETTLPLGTGFVSGTMYTVRVNGESVQFIAQ